MVLTLVVWIYMYIRRLSWIFANKPESSFLSTPEKFTQITPEVINYPANNLKNLFELPILFYAVCLYLAWSSTVNIVDIYCAYGFFVFRVIHSVIHCTVNIVLARFGIYILSSIFLWVMIVRSAYQLIS
ncbi:MAPEG family protein [Crocosphaera sp.]|uniref:MAPEG family protein n=1 Tax=Crocosphaera sp. TaxID=2729996 RepID=UPI003F2634C8